MIYIPLLFGPGVLILSGFCREAFHEKYALNAAAMALIIAAIVLTMLACSGVMAGPLYAVRSRICQSPLPPSRSTVTFRVAPHFGHRRS